MNVVYFLNENTLFIWVFIFENYRFFCSPVAISVDFSLEYFQKILSLHSKIYDFT